MLWPALAALALALTFVAMEGAGPATGRHERTLEALRTLTLSDAALQRDVLRARAGLLASYDPIVAALEQLRGAALALQDAGAGARGAVREEIGHRAAELAAAVAAQEARVETFKSRYALLRNSLAYFGHLTAERGQASELSNAMLRFTGGEGREAAAEVAAALDRLAGSGDAQDRQLVAHGRLIVGTLPQVDRLVGEILEPSIAERTQAVQEAYLDEYRRATARADRFRILLYAAALVLVAYLGYLFLRLRRNARRLRARLAFESLIAAISTAFIDLPREALDAGLEDGLARLGAHIGVDRARLVVAGDGVERAHAWRRDGVDAPDLPADDVLAVVREWRLGELEAQGLIHVPRVPALPDGPEKSLLQRGGVATWLCIRMERGERLALLAFDAFHERKWPEDDLALLRTAVEIFANAVERERGETERQGLQDRLAQAQRLEAVGTLAGGIAHEFNNVLGVVMGATEMAIPAAGEQVRRRLAQIAAAADRGQRIVDQVLAFSRRRERRDHVVRVQPAIAEAIELIRVSLPATVTLRARLQADDAAVRGDAAEVQQVVMNLCTNAVHAMDGRGTLEVALDTVAVPSERVVSEGTLAAGDYVRLAVRDTGHGMDEATRARIFEPFFTTKGVGKGTGLGLPTVHGYVTQYGGALNVTSRPGQGSTFEAFWPVTGARDEGEAAAPAAGGNGETILVVDDEPALVLLGEDMLAALRYEPVGFAASADALAAFRADPGRFDLALLDEVMPEMTGSELAAALRAIRPDLPVVVMTGHRGAVPAGAACELLAKPLRSASLAACLARHLQPAGDAGAS
jgi:signal transduction histidine kinase/CheY-like chemotaxis protein